jgi:hypothetical protein
MMSSYIQGLENADVQTPAPKSRNQTVHRTSGYSSDVADNVKNSENPRVLAKEKDKLKFFGIINISDNTEDDRLNIKKRTTTNTLSVATLLPRDRTRTKGSFSSCILIHPRTMVRVLILWWYNSTATTGGDFMLRWYNL